MFYWSAFTQLIDSYEGSIISRSWYKTIAYMQLYADLNNEIKHPVSQQIPGNLGFVYLKKKPAWPQAPSSDGAEAGYQDWMPD